MVKEAGARVAVTVRIPRDLMQRAKSLEPEAGSFNDLVIKALEKEVRRLQWREALRQTDELAESTFQAHGLLSDSTQLIRQLREGIGRRD